MIKDKIININSLCDLKVGDFYRTYFKFYKLTQVVISVLSNINQQMLFILCFGMHYDSMLPGKLNCSHIPMHGY